MTVGLVAASSSGVDVDVGSVAFMPIAVAAAVTAAVAAFEIVDWIVVVVVVVEVVVLLRVVPV